MAAEVPGGDKHTHEHGSADAVATLVQFGERAVIPGDKSGVVLFDWVWSLFLGVRGWRGEFRGFCCIESAGFEGLASTLTQLAGYMRSSMDVTETGRSETSEGEGVMRFMKDDDGILIA
jgi:hypothetical protein